MNEIRRILCCCSQGLGSSMIVHMNTERALEQLNKNIPVEHASLSEVFPNKFDCLIVGVDLAHQAKRFNKVIVLSDLMDMEELRGKLIKAFSQPDTFFIE